MAYLNRNIPVSVRTWFMLQNATHVTRSISEHLRSTRLPDSDLPVGRHFASSGHTTQDIVASVIRSGFRDATDRRSFEARMIFRHRTLHPNGLYVDFGFI